MCCAWGSACFYGVWKSQYRGQVQWLSSGKVSATARVLLAGGSTHAHKNTWVPTYSMLCMLCFIHIECTDKHAEKHIKNTKCINTVPHLKVIYYS